MKPCDRGQFHRHPQSEIRYQNEETVQDTHDLCGKQQMDLDGNVHRLAFSHYFLDDKKRQDK